MILGFIGAAFGCWVFWILWKYKNTTTVPRPVVKITFHNQADTVEGQVRGFCRAHPDVELEVLDAGSTDDTPEILKRLVKQYGFLYSNELKRYNASGVE